MRKAAVWLLSFAALLGLSGAEILGPPAEFHFLRMEYRDHPQARRSWGRGWWMQDWPEAEMHFNMGIKRMTRIDVGEIRHTGLMDDGIYEYPWIYATQVGWWDLSDGEARRLGEYLRRGGFLVVDDFFGPSDWQHFAGTMARVLPDRPIEELRDEEPVMRVVFDIKERVFIPGLRHLRNRGMDGVIIVPTGQPPTWRAIYDAKGNMVVAINFNVDVGDAWEHADMPEYPENMTSLAYRFGINYIVYAMTH